MAESSSSREFWFQGNRSVRVYSSFAELMSNFPERSTYISVLEDGREPLDFYWDYRGFDRTIVLFHASLAKTVARLPVFLGLSVTSDLQANRLFVADPAHYSSDNVIIGWFLGTAKWPNYQKLLIDLLAAIQVRFGRERMALFGPSAGGYASLFYSSYLPGSIAVPVNPQTNLTLRSDAEIRPLCGFAWNLDPGEYDPFRRVRVVKDVVPIYSLPTSNRVLYIQNRQDRSHVVGHLLPLIESLHPDVDLKCVSSDWGRGHVAPPKEFTELLLAIVGSGVPFDSIAECLSGVWVGSRSDVLAGGLAF